MKLKKRIKKIFIGRRLAQKRLTEFVSRVNSEIENGDFDLVVCPGNSGLIMGYVVNAIYEHKKINAPQVLPVPVYRDGTDKIPNVSLNKKDVSKVLFVDDEIATGTSLELCLRTILPHVKASHVDVTVVAQSHHFAWKAMVPGVSVRFVPYSTSRKSWTTNEISLLLDRKDFRRISKVAGYIGEEKQVMALLLTGKVKSKDGSGNWVFDSSLESVVMKRVPNYLSMQRSLSLQIDTIVRSGIK